MSTEEAGQKVFEMISAAVDRNAEDATDLLAQVMTDGDTNRGYGVCCAIATAGERAMNVLFGDKAPAIEHGGQWVVEQLKPGGLDDPHKAFAVRFLIAYANGQTDTARTHFETMAKAGPHAYVAGVSQLLCDVAGLCRTALEQHEAGGVS